MLLWAPCRGMRRPTRRCDGDDRLQYQIPHEWAKAALMIRESLEPDSPHVMIVVTPGRGGAGAGVVCPVQDAKLDRKVAGRTRRWRRLGTPKSKARPLSTVLWFLQLNDVQASKNMMWVKKPFFIEHPLGAPNARDERTASARTLHPFLGPN